MARKKIYDDDDGRTIADMSGVQRRPLVIPRFPKSAEKKQDAAQPAEKNVPEMPREQRRALIGGSLAAALLVLLIFAVVIAAVILFFGHFAH